MSDLLLEVFSEEIPARMQRKAANDLQDLLLGGFKAAGLEWQAAQAYWTPRRLSVHITGLPLKTADVREERKGPKADAPQKAIEGFLRGAGLASIEQAERRDTPKGPVYFAVFDKPGQETASLLPALIQEALGKLVWPKSMRWGHNTHRWVRPLQSILALFDGESLDGEFQGLAFQAKTQGHRFMAPGAFAVRDFADYQAKLKAHYVVLDPAARKAKIAAEAQALAQSSGLQLIGDDALLEEVSNLVEWPVPILGRFDPSFLDVPRECLILSMKEHQKFFALNQADGSLAPAFITVANIETPDQGAAIRQGNERVLNARLADAQFFWQQDLKQNLDERAAQTKHIVFHAAMGSVWDKTQGVAALAQNLASHIPGANPEQVARAVALSKADLVSGMVGEFPELQGIMGRYYALNSGEPEAVADAIAQHYAPLGPSDACPAAPVSVAAALADKLWTLAEFWRIDEKPTGSKDPFALRRAALGVIRLVLENGLRLALRPLLQDRIPQQADDLMRFLADRLKVSLRDQGLRHDSIDAAFPRETEGDLVRLVARVGALESFRQTEAGENLQAAYRRAANILRAEAKKGPIPGADAVVHAGLLQADEEQALAAGLEAMQAPLSTALAAEDFEAAMAHLAGLRAPLDAFFDKVTVNADDPALRHNRLTLLVKLTEGMDQVADFSQLEGS